MMLNLRILYYLLTPWAALLAPIVMVRELHCVPGNDKPLVPKAHEASKRKYRIGDPPLFQVNSIAGDCSQPLSLYIDDVVTHQVTYW